MTMIKGFLSASFRAAKAALPVALLGGLVITAAQGTIMQQETWAAWQAGIWSAAVMTLFGTAVGTIDPTSKIIPRVMAGLTGLAFYFIAVEPGNARTPAPRPVIERIMPPHVG